MWRMIAKRDPEMSIDTDRALEALIKLLMLVVADVFVTQRGSVKCLLAWASSKDWKLPILVC